MAKKKPSAKTMKKVRAAGVRKNDTPRKRQNEIDARVARAASNARKAGVIGVMTSSGAVLDAVNRIEARNKQARSRKPKSPTTKRAQERGKSFSKSKKKK